MASAVLHHNECLAGRRRARTLSHLPHVLQTRFKMRLVPTASMAGRLLSWLWLIAAFFAGPAAAQTTRVEHRESIREIAETPGATVARRTLSRAESDTP